MTDDPRKPAVIPHWQPGFPAYSFLNKAAEEARYESRRYWEANNQRFPIQRNPGWYAITRRRDYHD